MVNNKGDRQSVVITGVGGGPGLGYELPLAFARSGAELTINSYQESESDLDQLLSELRPLGCEPAVVVGDISTEQVAQELVATAESRYERVDVLVNNASISTPTLCHEMSLERWQRTIDVNLTSVFLTTRAALGPMRRQRSGRIVNIASQVGQKGAVEHGHYAAAKAGVIAFTKSIAREVADFGITANCVAPGPLNTRLMRNVSQEWRDQKLSELVLPRFGEPSEVVPSVLFLASDPGGNLYTGQTLGPNSGDVML
ncbi:SDR family NAD(P)-dependent oxidoreductase [Microlunatus soli]|uniref:3-oxoacyl-[acyl-carrier protein] reductase n=1 Tax=Microlunatus soli TaxID=630515 RepID=A0A1H1YA21_9ACTN|nr:SDR family NAD(P)-dependent oxidoreductase [Microlunatus soli]SDT18293.1 3-oxoacyl-[acyl-carrier protein] reductase [Microlunatus soli]